MNVIISNASRCKGQAFVPTNIFIQMQRNRKGGETIIRFRIEYNRARCFLLLNALTKIRKIIFILR